MLNVRGRSWVRDSGRWRGVASSVRAVRLRDPLKDCILEGHFADEDVPHNSGRSEHMEHLHPTGSRAQ